MTEQVPTVINVSCNRSALQFVRDKSTHSDIWEKLWEILKSHEDIKTFCPEPSQFRYAVAYVGFRIFAFTVGMGEIYVRLNPEALARAVGSGAEMEPVPDDDWVFFPLWQAGQAELPYREFVELAYAHAKTESEGGT